MDRRKYLYRVTARWRYEALPDGTQPADRVLVRHYQSKAGADHRAAVWREGRPPVETYDHLNGSDGMPAIQPAAEVTIERSLPVQWEAPA